MLHHQRLDGRVAVAEVGRFGIAEAHLDRANQPAFKSLAPDRAGGKGEETTDGRQVGAIISEIDAVVNRPRLRVGGTVRQAPAYSLAL